MPFNFNNLYADHISSNKRLKPAERGFYDFAVAYPDPISFPKAEIIDCLKESLDVSPFHLSIYPHPQGNASLRDYICYKIKRDRDIAVNPDEIILGNGSGQNIDIICSVLLNPDDVVITDDFVYGGTLNTLKRHSAEIIGISSDENGMNPIELNKQLRFLKTMNKTPKFVYLIPTFQNPQGFTIPLERRKELLKVCAENYVPIVEDDCYFDNRYDGEPVTSLYSLDVDSMIIYVGSFSKTIAPGMSLGYMTGPSDFLDRSMGVKSGRVSEFAAMAVEKYAANYLDKHIIDINNIQKVKRDAMLSALGENFGDRAKWSKPEGGLYIWLEMNKNVDITEAQKTSINKINVGFHSGVSYSASGMSGKNCIRLCYGYNQPVEIREGIAKLSEYFADLGII